jgi:hypothetical protein
VLTDANANGDCAPDLQKAFNDLVALGGSPTTFTFYPLTQANQKVCDLNTVVRMCYDSTPATGTTVPDCTGTGTFPTIALRGPWNKASRTLLCKAIPAGTQPEGCLWIGDAWNEGNLNNLVTLDIPPISAPYIEQYSNDPGAGAVPADAQRPFLCDGCTGIYAVHVRASSRTDIDGLSNDQIRAYVPPSFVGNSMTVNVSSDAVRGSGEVDNGQFWNDFATVLGASNTITGTATNLPFALGVPTAAEYPITSFGSTTHGCQWSATWNNNLACSTTFDTGFNATFQRNTNQAGLFVLAGTSLTFNGRLDFGDTTTPKNTVQFAPGILATSAATFGAASYIGGSSSPTDSVVTITSTVAAPGTLTFNGTIVNHADGVKRTEDKVGIICYPGRTAVAQPITLGSTYTYVTNAPPWEKSVALAYRDATDLPCEVTAPGSTTGSKAIASGSSAATTKCIDFTTGDIADCSTTTTRQSVAVDTMLNWVQVALTGNVTGGKTCTFDVRVNGGNAQCYTCTGGPKNDGNYNQTFSYGSLVTPTFMPDQRLTTSGDVVREWLNHMVPAGGYWQVRVAGSASCTLTGPFTLTWSTYPNL